MKLVVLVVSHAHGSLAQRCAAQIHAGLSQALTSGGLEFQVVLLHNIAEPHSVQAKCSPRVRELWNIDPAGFAANHNRIFLGSDLKTQEADWFLIANPDLDWGDLKAFKPMLQFMRGLAPDVGAFTLRQVSSKGKHIDYVRRLITPWQLLRRVMSKVTSEANEIVTIDNADWFNGASMLVRREAFQELNGFDERYHMYCEDVDFCLRLQLANWRLGLLDVKVTHDGRRSSRKHWRFFLFHVRSLFKLWISPAFWRYLLLRASTQRLVVSKPVKQPTMMGDAQSYSQVLSAK